MKQKLSLVTLGVTDLPTSRKFYEESLGFVPDEASNDNVVFYDTGSTWLGLFPAEELAKDASVNAKGSGFKKVTLAHNESSKEAVDQLFAELKEKGVKIVKEPVEVFWGGYSGYFTDPDDHLWEVAYNPFMDLT
jgi:uncharacterized protein